MKLDIEGTLNTFDIPLTVMKLRFKCPVCTTPLNSEAMFSSGPCPSCQNILEVNVTITAEEPALTPEIPNRNITSEDPALASTIPARRVGNWKCSGKPHGTFDVPVSR